MRRYHVTTFGCQMNAHDSERIKGMLESLGLGEAVSQDVNSYGRDVGSSFDELLRACDAVEGIERIRFTSPHPKDFRAPVIAAMAECAAVCAHAHLPLQSGSTRILKAMRRTYSRERYLRLVGELRAAIPDLALTTDLIVGFPGETEDDFRETLEVVEEVGFDSAFTFVFSPRHGTEAATMPGQVPDGVKAERIERLIEVCQRVALRRNATRIGAVVRADSVRALSDAGWDALLAYGVSRIVDLRFHSELALDPPRDLTVEVVHVPLMPEVDDEEWVEIDAIGDAQPDAASSTRAVYLEFLERRRP